MSRRTELFLFALAVTVIYAILARMGSDPTPLRVLLGIPFVFLLPGHALTLLVDPRGRLDRLEWFTVAIGSSLSIAVLVGLVLADSRTGFTPGGWLSMLWGATLLLVVAAAWPHKSSPTTLLPEVRTTARYLPSAALLIGCLMVILAALTPVAPPARGIGDVLQLWVLPTTDGLGARVGVDNLTDTSTSYLLKVTQRGKVLSQQRLDMSAKTNRIIEVQPRATEATAAPIVAELSDINRVVLRRVSLWLPK